MMTAPVVSSDTIVVAYMSVIVNYMYIVNTGALKKYVGV